MITRGLLLAIFVGVPLVWLVYGLVGHQAIETMYRAKSNQVLGYAVMAGKNQTPLEDYLEAADTMLVVGTFRLIAVGLVLVLLVKAPLALFCGLGLAAAISLILFGLGELFPGLGSALHLDKFGGHHVHTLHMADAQLVHRLKPHLRSKLAAFGDEYAPAYGLETQSRRIEWVTDEDGFRNAAMQGFTDVVVIGDGMIVEGDTFADTFAARLERQLGAGTVRNLGTGGYGPFQYVEVLKRYALKRKPKVALIAFNEGNDLRDVETYLLWKTAQQIGKEPVYDVRTPILAENLSGRYVLFLTEIVDRLRQAGLAAGRALLIKLDGDEHRAVHPDIALLETRTKSPHAMLLVDKLIKQTAEEILGSPIGTRLREIMVELKNLCAQNNVVPMILFIPSAAHVYAEHSTERSGRNWLKIRTEQIASKRNVEQAIGALTATLQIDLINLAPVFETAAKNGQVLYYPLSSHWNAEGMEVAARFVADSLRSKLPAWRPEAAITRHVDN